MVVQNVVHVVRKRLRASDDEQIATLGETLTDEQIARLTAWSADGTLQDIGNTVCRALADAGVSPRLLANRCFRIQVCKAH